MNVIKNIKVRKTLVWALKLVLFVVVIYFFQKQISKISIHQFQSIHFSQPIYFIFVLLLLPLNWGFELVKWIRILQVNQLHIGLKKLLSSLFFGVTTGLITPNRIGNFIGRIYFFKGKIRSQLILGTLYSNFSQFVVTLIFGVLSFAFLHDIILHTYGSHVTSLAIAIAFFSLAFYFSIPFVRLPHFLFLNRKRNVLSYFQNHSKKLVFPFLFLSAVRYLVFSFQFLFMLMAFDVEPTIQLLGGIFLLYLVSTLTPSLLFGKLVVRETAGLLILAYFIENNAIIVVSSLFLWFINLGIPSVVGLLVMLRKKTHSDG